MDAPGGGGGGGGQLYCQTTRLKSSGVSGAGRRAHVYPPSLQTEKDIAREKRGSGKLGWLCIQFLKTGLYNTVCLAKMLTLSTYASKRPWKRLDFTLALHVQNGTLHF